MSVVLGPLLQVLLIIMDLYIWIILIGIILHWLIYFNVINTQNKFVYIVGDFIHRLTEPIYRRIRSVLPNLGGLDLSPMILILGLIFLKGVVHNIYFQVA